ncbi:c-type cytochrome [Bordetella bronchialis]
MAGLAKGAVMVGGTFAVLVAGVSALFRIPGHHEEAPPARTAPSASAPAPVTPQAAAPGAPGAQPATPATAPPQAAAPQAGAPQAAAAPPPRTGTEFSFPQARWEQLLAQNADQPASAALPGSGNPPAGVAACASCHGAQGVPAPGTPFPVLAGTSAEYLLKQLLSYRDGTRQHPIMTGIAKGLSDQDMVAAARYYAGLPAPAIKAPAPAPDDRGQRLHAFGDNALALAACANCHGANGEGEPPMLPRLAGQPEAYLGGQLEAFRNGQRSNDDLGTMREIAKRLSPEDTAALAKYYAGMRGQ